MNLWNAKPGMMQTSTPVEGSNDISSFFGTLLQSGVIVHIYHLKSTSYAEHMALGGFYDAIPDLADAVIEAYQGCKGEIVCCYTNSIEMKESPIQYLKELKEFVISKSTQLFQGNEYRNLLNEVDAITTLIDSTLYKLTFLK